MYLVKSFALLAYDVWDQAQLGDQGVLATSQSRVVGLVEFLGVRVAFKHSETSELQNRNVANACDLDKIHHFMLQAEFTQQAEVKDI